ncbi:MAG: acyl carrier protein [Magnetococcus sp. YQC-9]
MSQSPHDTRIFNAIAGALGRSVDEVERLAASQQEDGEQDWDSLQHIHINVALEAEFGVRFEPLEAVDLKTIPQIRAKLTSKLD